MATINAGPLCIAFIELRKLYIRSEATPIPRYSSFEKVKRACTRLIVYNTFES